MSGKSAEVLKPQERHPTKQFSRREIKRKLTEARNESMYDPLTGLLSDQGFKKRLNEENQRAKREGQRIVILVFDLNGLKKINDQLGHDTGDELIKTAANVLRASFRPTDLISRRGNKADEFTVAVQVSEMEQVGSMYSRVDENLKQVNQDWDGYPITFPAGGTEHDSDFGTSFAIADRAMFDAKIQSKTTNQNVLLVRSTS